MAVPHGAGRGQGLVFVGGVGGGCGVGLAVLLDVAITFIVQSLRRWEYCPCNKLKSSMVVLNFVNSECRSAHHANPIASRAVNQSKSRMVKRNRMGLSLSRQPICAQHQHD